MRVVFAHVADVDHYVNTAYVRNFRLCFDRFYYISKNSYSVICSREHNNKCSKAMLPRKDLRQILGDHWPKEIDAKSLVPCIIFLGFNKGKMSLNISTSETI